MVRALLTAISFCNKCGLVSLCVILNASIHCLCSFLLHFRECRGKLFRDTFYKSCLLSDDETVRNNVVDLFRVSFQKDDSDDDNPDAEKILHHAIQLYQEHRVSEPISMQFYFSIECDIKFAMIFISTTTTRRTM